MNRRGFIKGLGALMATTAMARPVVPEEFLIELIPPGRWFIPPEWPCVPPIEIDDAEYYVSLVHPSDIEDLRRQFGLADRLLSPRPKTFEGYVGEYFNFHIKEDPQIPPGKLTWA